MAGREDLALEPVAAEVLEIGRLDRDSAFAVKDRAELGPVQDLATKLDQIPAFMWL